MLDQDGILLDANGIADPSQRLRAPELRKLIAGPNALIAKAESFGENESS